MQGLSEQSPLHCMDEEVNVTKRTEHQFPPRDACIMPASPNTLNLQLEKLRSEAKRMLRNDSFFTDGAFPANSDCCHRFTFCRFSALLHTLWERAFTSFTLSGRTLKSWHREKHPLLPPRQSQKEAEFHLESEHKQVKFVLLGMVR